MTRSFCSYHHRTLLVTTPAGILTLRSSSHLTVNMNNNSLEDVFDQLDQEMNGGIQPSHADRKFRELLISMVRWHEAQTSAVDKIAHDLNDLNERLLEETQEHEKLQKLLLEEKKERKEGEAKLKKQIEDFETRIRGGLAATRGA